MLNKNGVLIHWPSRMRRSDSGDCLGRAGQIFSRPFRGESRREHGLIGNLYANRNTYTYLYQLTEIRNYDLLSIVAGAKTASQQLAL